MALMAMLILTGCGGSGDSKDSKSNKESGGKGDKPSAASTDAPKTTPNTAPSKMPADQQAQIGLVLNVGQLMQDDAVKSMMESNPQIPPFAKSIGNLSAYVSLPANMMAAPTDYNFYASLDFANAEDCKQAFELLMQGGPSEDAEVNGKSFKKIAAPGAPVVYVHQDGASIRAYSEAYAKSGSTNFASAGLQGMLNGEPKGEPFKLAVDIKSANSFLSGLNQLAPQAESFTKSNGLLVAGGGTGDLLFMLRVDTPDEETAKKVKGTVQQGLGLLALGAASQIPSAEIAPATNEFANYVLGNLKPKSDGNSVSIVVNKPDNYEELKKKMAAEAPKVAEEMKKKQGAGGFGPGPGPPPGFGPGPGGPPKK